MTVEVTHKGFFPQGYYYRVVVDKDTVIVDFTKGRPIRHMGNFDPSFSLKSFWQVTPAGGASIALDYAFRPDFDPDVSGHWADHLTHDAITDVTADEENGPLGALRFTVTGGSMTLEVWSPVELRIA